MISHSTIAGRFNARFARAAGTLLVGGAAEPLYLPAEGRRPAIIRYTRDYAQSALHEMAHWCLAGRARRLRVDYGLWYQPPPRSATDQTRFYAAEVPVQALEMVLAEVCGVAFNFSADDPGRDYDGVQAAFEARVRDRFRSLCRDLLHPGSGGETLAILEALHPRWRAVLTTAGAGESLRAG